MAYTTIDDPSVYFQTLLYTGNGSSSRALTNDGNSDLQPDWLWVKNRSNAVTHGIWDSSRGAGKRLTIATDAEEDQTNVASFNSDGFTVNTGDIINTNSHTYAAWQWKANGGTVANDTNGDITTSVQASQTAGFSIATYTGNGGSNQTLGHGLGAEPDFVIFKDRDSSSAWRVFVRELGASKFLNLNTADAANTSTNIFPSHSSTTIGVEQNDVMNKNSSNHIMYSFRSIQGYSKISSYKGNGNADGAFVYTGFRPAWIMGKRTTGGHGWFLFDDERDNHNPVNQLLEPHVNNAESNDSFDIDILSNGFKARGSENTINGNDETYVYMAFARHPFVSSKGVPVTAR